MMDSKNSFGANDLKKEDLHSIHSFEWIYNNKTPTRTTCSEAGTIENSLRNSDSFKAIAEKNKDKELFIVQARRGICSHSPCSLLERGSITLKYIKASDNPNKAASSRVIGISDDLVTFNVLVKGGKNIVKILRYPELNSVVDEIIVCGYRRETVKHALENDDHFCRDIFKKNFVLSCTATKVQTELSNLVDDLNGKTFQIVLLNKSEPPEGDSQSSSLDDAYQASSDYQSPVSDEKRKKGGGKKKKEVMPLQTEKDACSKPMPDHLHSQIEAYVKVMKTKSSELSSVPDLLHQEFSRNALMCQEVKTMKKLMDLSNSVCQVRINGGAVGSGFLWFGSFVLTNGHVIKDIYNCGQLQEKVSVHFSYESLDQADVGLEVKDVVCFEYKQTRDWALLRLDSDQTLPPGLLERFGFLPPGGGISIIGHPQGGVKKIDPCLIVSHSQVVEQVPLITNYFFADKLLKYESSFFEGSSGSPVFDNHCNVVAMHSGGFHHKVEGMERQAVVEYALPLHFILEDFIILMVEGKKFDVLREYLDCSPTRGTAIMDSVKKIIESRNNQLFKEAARSCVDDKVVQKFLEFFCQTEEPVPMEVEISEQDHK